jgi:hypothetical protein
MNVTLCRAAAVVLIVLCLAPVCPAEEFTFKSYSFVGELAPEGRIAMRISKDPEGVSILVASTGGAIATVYIEPSKAKAVGEALMQAETYYRQHQDFYAQKKNTSSPLYREERTDIVKVDGYQVIFRTGPRGEDFEVKLGKARPFNPMALMNKEEAMAVGKRLLKGEEMAKFVDRHITF